MPYSIIAGAVLGQINASKNQNNYDTQMKLAAETARNSPWTGMKPQIPQIPSATSDILAGASSGLGIRGALQGMANQNDMSKAYTGWLNRGGSPGATPGGGGGGAWSVDPGLDTSQPNPSPGFADTLKTAGMDQKPFYGPTGGGQDGWQAYPPGLLPKKTDDQQKSPWSLMPQNGLQLTPG